LLHDPHASILLHAWAVRAWLRPISVSHVPHARRADSARCQNRAGRQRSGRRFIYFLRLSGKPVGRKGQFTKKQCVLLNTINI
jgi:uncharacterized Zn-binding protein involved in type VI secretion